MDEGSIALRECEHTTNWVGLGGRYSWRCRMEYHSTALLATGWGSTASEAIQDALDNINQDYTAQTRNLRR